MIAESIFKQDYEQHLHHLVGERGQPLNRGLLFGNVPLWQDRYELNMKA